MPVVHGTDKIQLSRLGSEVVSMLITEPQGRGFEPGQGDEILRAIKIRSTPSSQMGSKGGSLVSQDVTAC
jgi:hypothetical protein